MKDKEPIYMKYFTYNFLLMLLEKELEDAHKLYLKAHDMIGELEVKEDLYGFPVTRTYDPHKDKRASDQLYISFQARTKVINDMKKQLGFAYSKAAHPNMIKEKGFFPTYE